MKCSYKKLNTFKIFGIKIFENDIILNLKTNQYYEVTFDGTDFWLKRASAPFNFMAHLSLNF